MPPVIAVSNLVKTYASGFQALKGINLDIRRGEIFALLGPNGAGKTTLINIICGIVNATSGSVLVDGHHFTAEYRAARSLIGLVPQELTTDAFETVWATVTFSRRLFGKRDNPDYVTKVLKDVALWDRKDSKIMTLSGGMKRRVLIAKALAHEPQILFLDEPTAGVDVELRRALWGFTRDLHANGTATYRKVFVDYAPQDGPDGPVRVTMAKDGSAGFRAPLSKGGSAIYRQTGANTPEFVFLDAEPTSSIGTGIHSFSPSTGVQTKILDNGSIFFSAYLTNGTADFANYLGIPGKLQTLVSTADVLPSGARTILPATPPQAAGHFVAFTAQPAAGRSNLFVSDMSSGTITRVVSDNDPALATAGGAPGDTVLAPNFFLNESGQVAFETVDANASSVIIFSSISFGTGFTNKVWSSVTTSNCGTIYLSSPPPAAGLTKIAAPGDIAPKSTIPFSCVALNADQ